MEQHIWCDPNKLHNCSKVTHNYEWNKRICGSVRSSLATPAGLATTLSEAVATK
jgi:hypothetical protein